MCTEDKKLCFHKQKLERNNCNRVYLDSVCGSIEAAVRQNPNLPLELKMSSGFITERYRSIDILFPFNLTFRFANFVLAQCSRGEAEETSRGMGGGPKTRRSCRFVALSSSING